ncbi:MAG: NUDIX domain-containing protein [Bacilli bacterium]|jgi:8-oxo-dGTP diphosphatase|nr:NUDIX domain-containing protein [Bacilli bacterium]
MKFNIIAIIDAQEQSVLMCLRNKEPYLGLYNFVGGKVEINEDDLQGAYRELLEETGISNEDVTLIHLLDFIYHLENKELQVFVGKLNKALILKEEKHHLSWIALTSDFSNLNLYAGDGNISYIIEQINLNKKSLW